MSVKGFLDTNVFVYLFDHTAPEKQLRAKSLVQEGIDKGVYCISFQVVQEALNVCIRKLGFNQQDAGVFLENLLQPLWKSMPTAKLYQNSLAIQSRFQYSFYDALIIAAALETGCESLYSEDLQHGQRIDQLTILNPFIA